ncbi:MAG: ATP-dependent DNA helicase RecG [Candidatus Kerfeldbacteria bacterium]
MVIVLETDIANLPKVGEKISKKINKLGIHNIMDLLFYYPSRYDDFSKITDIVKLKIGETATIKGQVSLIANKRAWRRKMYITECLINDTTESLKIIWFNQPFITKMIKQGDEVFFSGKIESTKYGLQMVNPSYEKEKKDQTHTARIVPVYPLTEKLTAKQVRYLIKSVLPLAEKIEEWLPENILKKYKLLPIHQAIREVHFPTNIKTLAQARTRLKFNEHILIQLKTEGIRKKISGQKSPATIFNEVLTKKFVSSLPFTLTNSQKQSAWEILQELNEKQPMNRLLQGDVGSGKTVVAALAMLNVIDNKYQCALMAPTEILANQHYKTIKSLFNKFDIKIALLTRTKKIFSDEEISQKELLENIENHKADIIIGTHSLIQQKVNFNKLGLVVVDEQHRFGVDQRKLLKQKNQIENKDQMPHLLSMTATPIPRSLALTLYGDLDLSLITEMPKNRKEIITKIVGANNRDNTYNFIAEEIKKERQVFVICPLIEESDKLGVKAATAEFKKLSEDIFPNLNIGLLHGKLNKDEKQKAMDNFEDNKTNILVATSVVEVGVDIPNATIMMIEGADRFGLAQLHQFRGRVGRYKHQSYCFLFTDSQSDKTFERLKALIESHNGFEIAEKDLELRGSGEIYGLKQSGFPNLKIASLTDFVIIKQTKEAAKIIFSTDPELNKLSNLKQRLEYFSQTVHLE